MWTSTSDNRPIKSRFGGCRAQLLYSSFDSDSAVSAPFSHRFIRDLPAKSEGIKLSVGFAAVIIAFVCA